MESTPASSQLLLTWHTRIDHAGGGVTLDVNGDLDRQTAPALSEHLDEWLDSGRYPIVLDVSEVQFMDLGGYRLLVETGAAYERMGRWLVLRRPSLAVRRLITMIGIPKGVIVCSW